MTRGKDIKQITAVCNYLFTSSDIPIVSPVTCAHQIMRKEKPPIQNILPMNVIGYHFLFSYKENRNKMKA